MFRIGTFCTLTNKRFHDIMVPQIVAGFGQKMDLHVFLIERKKRIEDIAKIESPHERLRQLDELEMWIESVRRPGWVIGHRLVAIEKLRARKEFCLNRKEEAMKKSDKPNEYFVGAILRAYNKADKPVTCSKLWDYVVMPAHP